MKKTILVLLSWCTLANAQTDGTYKTSVGSAKKVVISSGTPKLLIQGTAGSEIIIVTDKSDAETPEEAQGLRLVTPGGMVDNTGVGASVEKNGDVINIKIPKTKYFGVYTVKIPASIDLKVRESSNPYGSWMIENMAGEIDISPSYTNATIKDASGPVIANAGYGKLNVSFAKLNQNKPNAISGNSDVNVTLPADTKADLRMNSSYGDVFTDFDLLVKANAPNKDDEDEEDIDEDDDENEDDEEGATINVTSKGVVVAKAPTQPRSPNSPTPPAPFKDGQRATSDAQRAASDAHRQAQNAKNEVIIKQKYGKSSSYNYTYNTADCNECDNERRGGTVSTINGGGVAMKISSTYGNVYLRKKK